MSRDDARKLLGGYATGTLTAEEQRALFEAALEDQELFDALVREQPLRDLLDDPAARAQLLAAVDDASAPWYRRWWRPVPVAGLATALMVVAIVAVRQSVRPARRPVTMARVTMPPPVASPAPILPPPPAMAPAKPPVLTPLRLPGLAPAAPPPPPAAAAPPPPPPAAVRAMARAELSPGQAPAQARMAPAGAAAGAANGFVNGGTIPGLSQAFLPVHGTVTDATGAAVPSANVEVKSVVTGEVLRLATNERGEFIAPVPPGGAYQISASAPGFRTATVSGVTPASGMPAPVNLRLEVGASTEAVVVSTATSPVMPAAPSAPALEMAAGGGGRGGALARAHALGGLGGPGAANATGLAYRILQSVPGGGRVEVGAGGNVAAGATVILEVTPNADGYVRIARADGHVIANRAVRRMQPVETQLPKSRKPARAEFRLSFSSQPWNSKKPEPAGGESVTITLHFE